MEDKHNVILILLSSSGFISSFRRLFILSHSRFKVFSSFLFRSSKPSRLSRREAPSKSPQDFNLIPFILQFYLIILLLPEFFMVVRKDLIHSSSVHRDSFGGAQVSFLLAFRSAIKSPYSFEVEFCISSFFSAIQSFPFVAGYHLMILRCYL